MRVRYWLKFVIVIGVFLKETRGFALPEKNSSLDLNLQEGDSHFHTIDLEHEVGGSTRNSWGSKDLGLSSHCCRENATLLLLHGHAVRGRLGSNVSYAEARSAAPIAGHYNFPRAADPRVETSASASSARAS